MNSQNKLLTTAIAAAIGVGLSVTALPVQAAKNDPVMHGILAQANP